MPQRRTEVVIKIRPEIDWSEVEGREITVPIRPEPEPGREPTGDRGIRDLLNMLLGGAMASRVIAGIRMVGQAIKALGPNALYVAAAAAAVAATIGGMIAQGWLAVKVLQQVGKVGQAGLRLLWEGVKKAGQAFVWLAQTAIQLSIDALERFIGGVIKLGAAVKKHIVGFLRRAITTFADFEQSAANTVAVMGITGEAALEMRGKVMDLAKALTISSRFMATDAVQAMYHLSSAGFQTLEQLEHLTRAGIALGEATLTPLSETTEFLASTIRMFNLDADQAMRVTNALAAAITKSPALMEKLSSSFQYVGSTAAMYGLTIEQLIGQLMAMFMTGVKGSRAGMELQNVFNTLAKRTDKAVKVLKEYNINMNEMSIAQQGLGGVLREFEKIGQRLKAIYGERVGLGMLAELLQRAFTLRAGRGLARILMRGVDEAERFTSAVTGTNTALQIQRDQLKTTQGAWKILVSIWENVYYDVVQRGLAPALYDVMSLLRDIVAEARKTGIFVQFGQALGKVVYAVGGVIQQVAPAFLAAFDEIAAELPGVAQQIANTLLELTPTIIEALRELPTLIKTIFKDVIPTILEFATVVLPLLLDFAKTVLPSVTGLFKTLGKEVIALAREHGPTVIKWFDFLLDVLGQVIGVLPQLQPLIMYLVQSFMFWAPILANIAFSLLPMFERAAWAVLGILNQLATAALPVFQAGLREIGPLLNVLANQVFPAIVGLLGRFGDLAIKLMPIVASIIKKAMDVSIAALQAFGDALVSLRPLILMAAEWLDKNFYRAVATVSSIISELAGALSVLLPEALLALTAVAQYTVIPVLAVLNAGFMAFQGILWVVVRAVWLLVEGLKALGIIKAPDVESALEDIAGGIEDSLKLAYRFDKMLRGLPGVAIKAAGTIHSGLGKVKDAFGDVSDAAGRLQRQQEAMGRSGYGGYGGGGYRAPAAGGGYFGPQLTPAAAGAGGQYGYQIGPFYVNSADEMKAIFDRQYRMIKQQEEQAGRLRAGGRY